MGVLPMVVSGLHVVICHHVYAPMVISTVTISHTKRHSKLGRTQADGITSETEGHFMTMILIVSNVPKTMPTVATLKSCE
jgi:hypothetical protein